MLHVRFKWCDDAGFSAGFFTLALQLVVCCRLLTAVGLQLFNWPSAPTKQKMEWKWRKRRKSRHQQQHQRKHTWRVPKSRTAFCLCRQPIHPTVASLECTLSAGPPKGGERNDVRDAVQAVQRFLGGTNGPRCVLSSSTARCSQCCCWQASLELPLWNTTVRLSQEQPCTGCKASRFAHTPAPPVDSQPDRL